MASAPHPSSRPRQTWRERSRPGAASTETKRMKRWFSSIALLVLVGLLVWLIWYLFFLPATYLACLPVTEYPQLKVPPVPYFDNDYRYLGECVRVDNDLKDGRQTFAAMEKLGEAWAEMRTRPNDVLLLYASAHGISIKNDAYLLCGNFDSANAGTSRPAPVAGCLKISEFLDQVCQSKAGTKILILDAGHLPTDPQLGVIVNEFPSLLADAVFKTKDSSLWVLTANGMHESSHVSHARHQSIFNYFVVRGLAGEANSKRDNVVDLAELAAFVGWGVSDAVKSQYGDTERQTPRILWGGGDLDRAELVARMHEIRLAPSVKTKPTAAEPSEAPRDNATARLGPPQGRWPLAQTAPGLLAAAAIAAQPSAVDAAAQPIAAESKKPEPAPASPDAKNAAPAPAASPAAAQPTQGAPDAAKNEPSKDPAAQPSAAPPPEKPKQPAEKDSPKDAPPDKWSTLRKAWKEHDQRIAPDKDHGWSPIDYAPHVVREYEREILDYELRRRNRYREDKPTKEEEKLATEQAAEQDQTFELRKQGVEKSLALAEREFLGSPARKSWEQVAAIRDAIRIRNAALFRVVDLLDWHARASRGQRDQVGEYNEIDGLLRESKKLADSLAAVLADSTDEADRPDASQENDALRNAREVDTRLNRIEKGLNFSARSLLSDTAAVPGATRRLEDLLAIPLGDAKLRIELLEALERDAKKLDVAQAAKKTSEAGSSEPNDSSRARGEDPGRPGPAWARAQEQARLEVLLVGLADRAEAEELERALGSATDPRPGVRNFSADLAGFYRSLPTRIAGVARDSKPSALGRADRELRLLPAASAELFAVAGKNPILWFDWSPPPVRDFAFENSTATDKLDFDAARGWKELHGSLTASGGYSGEVQITVDFDDRKLRVTDESQRAIKRGESKQLAFDPDHASFALNYRVQPLGSLPARERTELRLVARAAGGAGIADKTWRIDCEVAPSDSVELVISPAASSDNPADEKSAETNGRLVEGNPTPRSSSSGVSLRRLSAFPGHTTAFVFKLQQHSERARRLGVELLGVNEADEAEIRKLQSLAKDDPDKLLERAGGPLSQVERLASVKEMKVSENASEPTAIPFPPYPPAPAKDAPPADPKKPPELFSVVGGMVVLVKDLDREDLGPWVTWIDVAPLAPWHYVEPILDYDPLDQKLLVSVGLPTAGAVRPLDGRPIVVKWVPSEDISQADIRIPEAKLGRENKFSEKLEAKVIGDSKLSARVELAVDGYPRAFVFAIARNAAIRRTTDQRLKNQESLRILRPLAGEAFRPGKDELNIEVQVSAPETSFLRGRGDKVEIGIDKKTGDGTIDVLQTSYSDRKHVLTIKKIGSDGRVAIDTEVQELQFTQPCPALNKRVDLVARLVLGGIESSRPPDRVEVVFDQTPPSVRVERSEYEAVRGGKALVRVTAEDRELSGVKSVSFVPDVDKRKLDEAARKTAKVVNMPIAETARFLLEWAVPEDAPLGPHHLLVWATDNVGLESDVELVPISVREKPKPETVAMPTTGIITGVVTYANSPVPRAKVQIVEGMGIAMIVKDEAVADDKGRYVLKNLKPGNYRLRGEGRAKNAAREGDAAASIPDPPSKKPVEVNVTLVRSAAVKKQP